MGFPETPFWLECTTPGYLPRLYPENLYPRFPDVIALCPLCETKSTAHDDGNLWPSMIRCKNLTFDEDIAKLPSGYAILAGKEWYHAVSGGSQEPPPGTLPARPAETFRVRVIDCEGSPIKEIILSGTASLRSEDGIYQLGTFSGFIAAPGLSREYVETPENPPAAPVTFMLFPASHISYSDKYSWDIVPANSVDFPDKDLSDDTTMMLPDVPPGEYYFAVGSFSTGGWGEAGAATFVKASVLPGSEAVAVGSMLNGLPSTLQERWHEWERKHVSPSPSEVDEEMKAQFAPVLARAWETIPVEWEDTFDAVTRLSKLTTVLGTKAVIPALKDAALRLPGFRGWYWADRTPMEAIVALAGDDAVDWLVENASCENNPYHIRCNCLFALGKLGTDRSIRAVLDLRNAAYGLPGAPAPRKSYTHAEKMAEMAKMILEIIPGPPPYTVPDMQEVIGDASVDEAYKTGYVCYSYMDGPMGLELRRFADEWIVVDLKGFD